VVPGVDEAVVLPDQLVAGVAGYLAELVVDVGDGPLLIGDGDDSRLVQRELQVGELLQGLAQVLLRLGPVGDVAGVDHDAPHGGVAQQVLADGLQPAPRAPPVLDPVLQGREGAGNVAVLPEHLRHAVTVFRVD
jgi:hypothetical protein